MAIKKAAKSSGKKTTVSKKVKGGPKKKSQIKAKPVMKLVEKKPEQPKQVNKVHPFAHFMKGKISNHYSSAPMSKFNNHDIYRKKAI